MEEILQLQVTNPRLTNSVDRLQLQGHKIWASCKLWIVTAPGAIGIGSAGRKISSVRSAR